MERDAPAGHGGSPSIARPDYWWYVVRAELLRTTLGRYVGTPARVLDVGSADGPSVEWLRAAGQHLHVSLDIDARGLDSGGVCGSVTALPFADGTFDVVSAFDVVEHCEVEAVALAELARVLAPGGRLLLSVPAYQWAWTGHDVENGHHRRYTRDRIVNAVERSGLDMERATYAFAAVFPAFVLERLARRVRERVRGGPSGPVDVVNVPTVPPAVDQMLRWLSRHEQRVLQRRDLPFGSSVFVAARKAAPPGAPVQPAP